MRILTVIAVLTGCSADDASSALNDGQETARTPIRCVDVSQTGNSCDELLPPERMQGIWVNGFEVSGFVPGATGLPQPGDRSYGRIWLSFAEGVAPDPALRAEMDKVRGRVAVAIEFVGRRSRHEGAHVHMGGARSQVVVDRILSARLLGPMPPNP